VRATPKLLILAVLSLLATTGAAQELTPRAYWPAPKGTKVAVLGYSYSTGVVTESGGDFDAFLLNYQLVF